MQTVVENPEFVRCVKRLGLTEKECSHIISFIADNPCSGDAIKGTGGARKIRFPAQGRGKSGGYRVITFYSGDDIPVFLLSAYAKGQKDDLTQAEKNTLRTILGVLAETYRNRKGEP